MSYRFVANINSRCSARSFYAKSRVRCSSKISSTWQKRSGYLTYYMTAKRVISGLVLKYLKAFYGVIHKNQRSTEDASSLSDHDHLIGCWSFSIKLSGGGLCYYPCVPLLCFSKTGNGVGVALFLREAVSSFSLAMLYRLFCRSFSVHLKSVGVIAPYSVSTITWKQLLMPSAFERSERQCFAFKHKVEAI